MAEEKEETTENKSAKEETPKKVKAPQKKTTKNKPVKKAVVKPMVHINDFLGLATDIYNLNGMQQAGFKAFMIGKHYLSDLDAFTPYLEKYLEK